MSRRRTPRNPRDFDHPEWRSAQTVDGIEIQAEDVCRPDNPNTVAAVTKGTNNVDPDVLMQSGLHPGAVRKHTDRDDDGDPDVVEMTLEVQGLNEAGGGAGGDDIAPGIEPAFWVFAPKTRGMVEEGSPAAANIRMPSPPLRVEAGDTVRAMLDRGANGERPETPTEGDAAVQHVRNHVLANNRTALDAAAAVCEDAGYRLAILSAGIEGEAREVGRVHAAIADSCMATGESFEPPVALLSGGETTVTVRGEGRGGPNQEVALGAAIDLAAAGGVGAADGGPVLASVDTDGIDGATDAAGALVDGATVTDRRAAQRALADNDAFTYLNDRDALVLTGPTGTNVNDLRVVLVGEP